MYDTVLHDDYIISIDEFDDYGFDDYDGFGYPAKDNLMDMSLRLIPSRIDLLPKDATHIVWFNR